MTEKEYRTEFARLGGKARANKMTLEQRIKHAKMMVNAKKAKQNKD